MLFRSDAELVALGLHAGDDLVLAAASGNVLEADVADPQALWSPLHVTAPTDQMCAAESDGCSARNRLVFEGLSAAPLEVFDHHAVATGTYDVLVGDVRTPIDTACDGTAYAFVLLRTAD